MLTVHLESERRNGRKDVALCVLLRRSDVDLDAAVCVARRTLLTRTVEPKLSAGKVAATRGSTT
jgi:hypothetical protein